MSSQGVGGATPAPSPYICPCDANIKVIVGPLKPLFQVFPEVFCPTLFLVPLI